MYLRMYLQYLSAHYLPAPITSVAWVTLRMDNGCVWLVTMQHHGLLTWAAEPEPAPVSAPKAMFPVVGAPPALSPAIVTHDARPLYVV